MLDQVRYIQKDGQSVDTAIVRRRFFEIALGAGVGRDKACGIWNGAIFGDPYARQIIDKVKVYDMGIVAADAGFGFFQGVSGIRHLECPLGISIERWLATHTLTPYCGAHAI